MRRYQFYHDPLFTKLKPADPAAEALLRTSRTGARVLDMSERIWLNRHLLEAAFREVTNRACFRRLDSGLDGVLVSDVGRPIKAHEQPARRGGWSRNGLRRHRHPHGPGRATGDGDVPRNARFRVRTDHGGGRAVRGCDGHAPGSPAAGGQHPHGLRSIFVPGNQLPDPARVLCWPQGVPSAAGRLRHKVTGHSPVGSDPGRDARHCCLPPRRPRPRRDRIGAPGAATLSEGGPCKPRPHSLGSGARSRWTPGTGRPTCTYPSSSQYSSLCSPTS